ncbi:putative reverse transcriptase zinc-binding domain-containing protein [Helianthus annuus]|nr:putative reverse transcriptase zinc-binding domain-containing protein [Helianthus annuus]
MKRQVELKVLCKWGWRYKQDYHNLWVKVVDAIHCGGSEWSIFPVKKSRVGVWHNIVSVLSKPVSGNKSFSNFFKGVVGLGDRILFWLDPWLCDSPLCQLYPHLFALEVVKNCVVKERVFGYWLWKHDPEPGVESLELSLLTAALSSVSMGTAADKWRWLGDHSGTFSVGSAKDVLRTPEVVEDSFILDWCKWTPSKCNLLVWRAELDRIPTADALSRRGVVVGEGLCPFCKDVNESVEHIFTSCFFSVVLWQKVSQWCRLPPIFAFSFRDLMEFHKAGFIRAAVRSAIQGIIVVSCWCLWQARNRAIFSELDPKVDKVFSDVKSLGYVWFKHRSRNNHISWLDWCNFCL